MPVVPRLPIAPLRYHIELVRHLRESEAELWGWFATDRLRAEQGEAVRLELLRSTYRLEPTAHPILHAAAADVAGRLGLEAPIALFQAQGTGGLNASLAFVPGEAHLVLHGSVLDRLSPSELRAVLGHELSHFALLDRWEDYRIASQLLQAMCQDAAAHASHVATLRRFGLYTEVYCDRGAHLACGDLSAAVAALVKVETGLAEVSAESFLRQADEVFGKGSPRTEGVTHPEAFIRARGIRLWVEAPDVADAELQRVLEGPPTLAELDLLGQASTAALTRRLVTSLLRPRWLQTELLLAHARLFFDDFGPARASAPADGALKNELATGDERLLDYWCYVLLDFAVADRSLEDASLAAALLQADALGLGDRFRGLATKELGLKKRQLEALDAGASALVARAAEAAEADPTP